MSWLSRSFTGLLQEKNNERIEEGGGEFWDDPELFEPGKSVKEDLSELRKSLTESLWGVASFLAPPPTTQQVQVSTGDDLEENVKETAEEEEEVPAQGEQESSSGQKKLSGIQNDFAELKGGFAKGLSRLSSVMRGHDERKNKDEMETSELDVEDASGGSLTPKLTLQASLANHMDGISKLASSLFPFINDDDQDDWLEAPGLTPDVIAFARDISKHPETWLDFPLAAEDDNENAFEMNKHQTEHAYAVERSALRLAALKVELCPRLMSEGRFWKIYFVLLHSRLSEEDAALLSTSQVLEARSSLLKHLSRESEQQGEQSLPQEEQEPEAQEVDERKEAEAEAVSGPSREADNSLVVDKDAIPSTIRLAPSKSADETEADEWLEEDESAAAASSHSGAGTGNSGKMIGSEEDEISFSDLEDVDDRIRPSEAENRAQGWVELNKNEDDSKKHARAGSNDWLTVDKEDATTTTTGN